MQNNLLLFLDDLRFPTDCLKHLNPHSIESQVYLKKYWIIIRSYNDFVDWITTNGLPKFISFDYDLGLPQDQNCEEQNGMTCAKWLVKYCLDHEQALPKYFVHSQNPVGKGNIEGYLEAFSKRTTKKFK